VELVCSLLTLYVILVFARIIASWFPISPDSGFAGVIGFLYTVTEPVLGPVRRAMPMVRLGGLGLDLSPIVVLFGIRILQGFIC
jgi:YggT family protein